MWTFLGWICYAVAVVGAVVAGGAFLFLAFQRPVGARKWIFTYYGSVFAFLTVGVALFAVGDCGGGWVANRKRSAEEAADRSANQAVLDEVRPLITECRRRGDAQALGKPGKVLVWDLRSDERAVSVEKALPAGCRTSRVEGDTTLYLITAGPLADPYDGGTSPVLEVCVVSWPARQALGCYLVAGAEFTGQLARWIDSGFDPGEARMAAITRLEGKVRRDDKAHGKPIIEVSLASGKVTDRNVGLLKGLVNLQTLILLGSGVTDVGLVHLEGLVKLQTLDLGWTRVTDAGLIHLKGLVNLQTLHLVGAGVADAGLVHLKRLVKLQTLDLSWSKVTDAGLDHLKGLPNLRKLTLRGTKVTDAGVADLRNALPKVEIVR